MAIANLTSKHQVTLPKEVRERLVLRKGVGGPEIGPLKAWDTSLLVRHLLENDAGPVAVLRAELEKASRAGAKIWLPRLALVETAWVLGTCLEKKGVLNILSEVLGDNRFVVQEDYQVIAAIAHARFKGDFPEHLIAQNSRTAGSERMQTFDRLVKGFGEFEVL